MRIRSPVTGVSVVCTVVFVVSLLCSAAKAQQPVPNTPSPQTPKTLESSWPRTFANGTDTFTIYQPQVEKWDQNLISLYCAVEVRAGKESAAKYGVVWFQARTEVDKVNRLVTLDQARVARVKFSVASDKEATLTALLEKKLPVTAKTISLDRLEAALEPASELVKGVEVNNDPPRVIIAKTWKSLMEDRVFGHAAELVADSTKLRRRLGWEPRRSGLREIVKDAWEFFNRAK